MTNNERLKLLAQHGISPIFVTLISNTLIAVSRIDQGYQARTIGKNGAILAQGCASEEAAVKAAQVALNKGVEMELRL